MNVRSGVIAAVLALSAATVGYAGETVPAWQEAGFVMEEVVVTASATGVMEEVIVTASARDVAAARLRHLHRRARMLVASSIRIRGGALW